MKLRICLKTAQKEKKIKVEIFDLIHFEEILNTHQLSDRAVEKGLKYAEFSDLITKAVINDQLAMCDFELGKEFYFHLKSKKENLWNS